MVDISKLNLPKEGPVAEALEQFSIHNMMLGAEILRDAAHCAVVQAAQQRGWPCETRKEIYDLLEKLDCGEGLTSGYMYAEGLPDKIRYRYAEITPEDIEADCWVVDAFLASIAGKGGNLPFDRARYSVAPEPNLADVVAKLDLPTEGPAAEALEQFAVHNMMRGAEILRDAAYHAVAKAAKQRGWPCKTQEQTYAAIEALDSDELVLSQSWKGRGRSDGIWF
ncbi:MAG: hypothetical protein OXU28_16070, partial [Chloroflexota bacterium]|nr:hypothetical protein [Chloroflexota bacterium]